MSTPSTSPPPMSSKTRFRIFLDFWNFQLTLNERIGHSGFKIDWRLLPRSLVQESASLVGVTDYSYEGMIVFTSYNGKTEEGRKYRNWATSWLDIQPGIQVQCYERRPRTHPKCPACHKPVEKCPDPSCAADMAGTVEKGVDTAIATNMIRLAWERSYDVAILASSDADLVPAVEFLDLRGFRIIQAGFPPSGAHLSRACWGTVDVAKIRHTFERS